jgi:hypothetical protein
VAVQEATLAAMCRGCEGCRERPEPPGEQGECCYHPGGLWARHEAEGPARSSQGHQSRDGRAWIAGLGLVRMDS